ncbi:hypothetical protein IE53DRAFT_384489 [Violaceomyces palustris]|uniref:Uncharacterized protein n=1 Tax=Violaceomyces palustris TaxID=1673888 RepID=A0ACD0P4K1_9BASI|nr:hypothetical protein IE53DRAFT_384489 [Violaceomyces palustris]
MSAAFPPSHATSLPPRLPSDRHLSKVGRLLNNYRRYSSKDASLVPLSILMLGATATGIYFFSHKTSERGRLAQLKRHPEPGPESLLCYSHPNLGLTERHHIGLPARGEEFIAKRRAKPAPGGGGGGGGMETQREASGGPRGVAFQDRIKVGAALRGSEKEANRRPSGQVGAERRPNLFQRWRPPSPPPVASESAPPAGAWNETKRQVALLQAEGGLL